MILTGCTDNRISEGELGNGVLRMLLWMLLFAPLPVPFEVCGSIWVAN